MTLQALSSHRVRAMAALSQATKLAWYRSSTHGLWTRQRRRSTLATASRGPSAALSSWLSMIRATRCAGVAPSVLIEADFNSTLDIVTRRPGHLAYVSDDLHLRIANIASGTVTYGQGPRMLHPHRCSC